MTGTCRLSLELYNRDIVISDSKICFLNKLTQCAGGEGFLLPAITVTHIALASSVMLASEIIIGFHTNVLQWFDFCLPIQASNTIELDLNLIPKTC